MQSKWIYSLCTWTSTNPILYYCSNIWNGLWIVILWVSKFINIDINVGTKI